MSRIAGDIPRLTDDVHSRVLGSRIQIFIFTVQDLYHTLVFVLCHIDRPTIGQCDIIQYKSITLLSGIIIDNGRFSQKQYTNDYT